MRSARPVSSTIILYTAVLVTVIFPAVPADAVWINGGTPVCTESNDQRDADMVSDGAGGVIMVWEDSRFAGSSMIYAQRFDRMGNALWTAGGVSVCGVAGSKNDPVLVSDGEGGAVIAWSDNRSGDYDIYAQRIDRDGNLLWYSTGVMLCGAADNQWFQAIATDEAGGAIVAWEDSRSGSDKDIYARRIDANGNVQWALWGVAVCTAPYNQDEVDILSDGEGGAYIVWDDSRDYVATDSDIYLNRTLADGTLEWVNGTAVCAEPENQFRPALTRVNGDHMAVVWNDNRNSTSDLYTQLYYDTFEQLTAGGEEICSITGAYPATWESIVDMYGRLIVCWTDDRTGDYSVYAQCFNFASGPEWTVDGIRVCEAGGDQYKARIVPDGEDGSIIVWRDHRYGDFQGRVYAQRISSGGTRSWDETGIPMTLERDSQEDPVILSDGEGGAFIAWEDGPSGEKDLYATRIDRFGYTGDPAPAIHAARDVPGDQGGHVEIAWFASYLDPAPFTEITHYTLWKALTQTQALAADGARFVESCAEVPKADPEHPVIRIERTAEGTFFWELVGTQTAQYYDAYSKVVETDFDSSGAATGYHYFQVAAHTSDPEVVFNSEPDSCRSVDNLAPASPSGLSGEQVYAPAGLFITWDPNSETDLALYSLYRGTSDTFEPGAGNLLTSVADTEIFDDDWTWDSGYYYKLAAVDVHGNESGCALLAPVGVTGDDDPGTPAAPYLGQNYPNPFNPATTISYYLPVRSGVRLEVFGAGGARIAVLEDGVREKGMHEALWDGTEEGGRPAASGVYFYRLSAGSNVFTRKMILLR